MTTLRNVTLSADDQLIAHAREKAGAKVLYSEDLQHNQLIAGTLRIVNPFLAVANESASQ